MKKVRVLIVDDSAVVRQVMSATLQEDPDIQVIGAVSDPLFAIERLKKEWPDVIVLDVEMPRMDGITFLKKIMSEHPTPVVICSTLTEAGAATTMQALSAGAVGIVCKPKVGVKDFLQDSSADLVHTVKVASHANIRNLQRALPSATRKRDVKTESAPPVAAHAMKQTTERVIAIGTSTGGTQALELVLSSLPRVTAGIVVVQHMPERFTALFADRLNKICEIEVKEAQNNDRVLPGRALIAPGGRHMSLKRNGAYYFVEVADGPLVNRHKPSVDVLFRSVAKFAGRNAAGFIMTGMGDDGASGLAEMHTAGAYTVAQDQASCVVFGMPGEAIKRGGVDKIVALDKIAAEIVKYGAGA